MLGSRLSSNTLKQIKLSKDSEKKKSRKEKKKKEIGKNYAPGFASYELKSNFSAGHVTVS